MNARRAHDTEEQVPACVRRVQQMGVRDVVVGGDVSREQDPVRMVQEAVEASTSSPTNAGIQISRPSEELSSDDFDRMLVVKLRGSFIVRPSGDQAVPRRARRAHHRPSSTRG